MISKENDIEFKEGFEEEENQENDEKRESEFKSIEDNILKNEENST